MAILISNAGFLTTVQDSGRFGYEKYGVSSAGPMDRFALQAANLLLGNRPDFAGLEFGVADVEIIFGDDCLIAVTGAGYQPFVNGQSMPLWMSIFIRRGSQVSLRKILGGNWGYLAISGGIAIDQLLGSRSTYLKGKMGGVEGMPLSNGTLLPIRPQPEAFHGFAGRSIPEEYLPRYAGQPPTTTLPLAIVPLAIVPTAIVPTAIVPTAIVPIIEVIPGPQEERFTPQGIETFYSSIYKISSTSDRMGYRLEGTPIEHAAGADILSDGMSFGSVQVPASGQPIVMMSEHPTTGGYTKIATVISADLPVLAQCTPGVSQVRFRQTSVEAALARYRKMIFALEASMQQMEEEYLSYANG